MHCRESIHNYIYRGDGNNLKTQVKLMKYKYSFFRIAELAFINFNDKWCSVLMPGKQKI
jgi:hypothetical protein